MVPFLDSFKSAALEAPIPLPLLLATAQAESNFRHLAERWGGQINEALAALQQVDHDWLAKIVEASWPDISFGLSQHIVLYHYLGDHSKTLENILWVRAQVFCNPARDIKVMADNLKWRRQGVIGKDLSPVNGDIDLATCISYNRGSLPPAGHSYYRTYAGNIARYRAGLERWRNE